MRLSGVSTAVLGAVLLAAALGCKGSPSASCPPAPVDPPCPDAVPSFTQDVYPTVFQPACVRCHSSTGEEPKTPLTTYQQITAIAGSVYYQVFEACLMPPSNAPEILTDGQRQKLLDWFGCGTPDTGAPDAGMP